MSLGLGSAPLKDRDLLARLVGVPSVSGRPNREMVDGLASYLDVPGVRLHQDVADDGQRANLIAWVGPESGATDGQGLTLSGHLDVVPAGEEGWSSDPFSLTADDDRLVGRGATDMKGFVALAVNVLRAAAAERLDRPLAVVLTYDEEVGTVGARDLAQRRNLPEPLPTSTVVGEPTRLRVVRQHKGHVKLRLVVDGVSAHSGYPHLGVSAIEPAARAVVELGRLRDALGKEAVAGAEEFPDAPHEGLNVGVIRGGSAVNVVPDRCVVDIGLRTLPGSDEAALVARVRDAVARGVGEVPHRLEDQGVSPPLGLPRQAPAYVAACDAVGQPLDQDHAVAYATDAGWLQAMGLACVVCGPGDIARAHRPDEYITLEELAAGRRFVDAMVRALCHAP